MINKQRKDYLNWDQYFMGIAKLSAMRSKDPNTQVGACIVSNDNRILSIGYNGTPNGFENECETWAPCGFSCTNLFDKDCEHCKEHKLVSKPYVLHAEANAILKVAKSTQSSDGATFWLMPMCRIPSVRGWIILQRCIIPTTGPVWIGIG